MTKKKGVQPKPVADPEEVLELEQSKKKSSALNSFKVARKEFIEWYVGTIGVEPDWTQPPVNWMFNAWIAAQGGREWLTEEDLVKQEKLRERMERIVAVRKLRKLKPTLKG